MQLDMTKGKIMPILRRCARRARGDRPVSSTPASLTDPTGCGDAYRAGLLYGIEQGMDWEQTGRLASLMGALKIACRGGQNHAPSRDEIAEAYRQTFGSTLW